MENEIKTNIVDLALNSKPDEFEKAVTDSLSDRILRDIEEKRKEVAIKIFGFDPTTELDDAYNDLENDNEE